MEQFEDHNIENSAQQPAFRRKFFGLNRTFAIIGTVVLLVVVAYRFGIITHAISVDNPISGFFNPTPALTSVMDQDYVMPKQDDNRINILIMGIEGQDDPNAAVGGPLLTDSIEVFSYDKTTKKSSLISIPRDLYVTIYGDNKDKLNTAYQYGYYHTTDGLQFVKEKISQITGVYIDHVVIFDFSSFKQIVDALGGIDVTLDKPFTETEQWGYAFSLPAGKNHLDGQSALYYVRSRYSTSDFDRSRRQQQIMFAVKNKILAMNFLSDPVKTFAILNLVRNDILTDITIWDIKDLMDLVRQVNFSLVDRTVISTDNLVQQGTGPDNAFILLPKAGNLSGVKQLFANSLK